MKILGYGYFGAYLTLKTSNRFKINREKKISNEAGENEAFRRFNEIFRHMVKKSKTNIEITGAENIPKEACVFVGNHQGLFDPIAVSYAIDKSYKDRKVIYIAKKQLSKVPVLAFWMKSINTIFVDRENPKDGIRVIKQAISKVKNGISIVIFPEGTRNYGEKVKDFKGGSVLIAKNAKCLIVPFTIDGSQNVLEVGKTIFNNDVKIIFHKPVNIQDYNKEELKNLEDTLKKIVVSGFKKTRKK